MAAATFESIVTDLKNRKFAPIYCFCGEEDFYIDELTDMVEKYALNDIEKAFNQTIVYGKELTSRQVVEIAGRLPMMAERQVLIIKEANSLNLKSSEEEEFLRYLKKPVKSTIVVFSWKHGKPDGRKSFGIEMKKAAVFFESLPLTTYQVVPWIKNWLSQKKYKIDGQAAELLVEYTGNELSKVANELEKLIINKQPGATITLDDIEAGVGISKEYNPFELNNALANRDKTKAYKIVNYFIANPKSGPFIMILGTLFGYFTKVYLYHLNKGLPDKDIAGAIKVSPFFIKDYKSAAQQYPLQKLEQIFNILEEFDLRVKGINNRSLKEGELLKEMVTRILN